VARSGCLALVFLSLCGSSCLLYTEDLNHSPTVDLMGDAETTWKAKPGPKYHAQASDQDQSADSLSYEWHRQLGACPASLTAAGVGTVPAPSKADFENDFDFDSQFCVWVLVRDKHGATAWDSVTTKVKHLPTTAMLEVVKPTPSKDDHFPFMTVVQLSGAKSRDPESNEPLQFDWMVTRNGEKVMRQDCPDPANSEFCFTGDQDGTYSASLTVRDGRGGADTKKKDVFIDPDAPPCIERTEPMYGIAKIVRDATEENTFELKAVSDDVDPFPSVGSQGSKLSFEITWWHMGEDPSLPSGRRATGQGDQMPVAVFAPGYFKNGDQVFVRIKAFDRVDRSTALKNCSKDNCELDPKGHPGCYQWVTWTVDFRPLREM